MRHGERNTHHLLAAPWISGINPKMTCGEVNRPEIYFKSVIAGLVPVIHLSAGRSMEGRNATTKHPPPPCRPMDLRDKPEDDA